LSAALAVMAERGYRGMSIPAVAEAAGVSKPTIYLRFPSKFDLALAALASLPLGDHAPDTGSTRGDLVALLREMQEVIERMGLGILGTVLAEEVEHPELLERLRNQLVRPRARSYGIIIERGIERGEVRADADIEVTVNLLNGAYITQHLAGGPILEDWAERLVDLVQGALEPGRQVGQDERSTMSHVAPPRTYKRIDGPRRRR
jgi:AcrR family transcriptional regulator